MNRIEQLNLVISKVEESIFDYKTKVNTLSSCIKTGEKELVRYKTELAELNKPKTGRVKIGDDLSGVNIMYLLLAFGDVVECSVTQSNKDAIAQGRAFYNRASAKLFALREATEYKIWCEFGDEVVIIFNNWQSGRGIHNFVRFDLKDVSYVEVCNFLDTLSEEELNSLRSE